MDDLESFKAEVDRRFDTVNNNFANVKTVYDSLAGVVKKLIREVERLDSKVMLLTMPEEESLIDSDEDDE